MVKYSDEYKLYCEIFIEILLKASTSNLLMILRHRRHMCWLFRNIELGRTILQIRRRLGRWSRFLGILQWSINVLILFWIPIGAIRTKENYLEELNYALSIWLNVRIWSFETGDSFHGTFHDLNIGVDKMLHTCLFLITDSATTVWLTLSFQL